MIRIGLIDDDVKLLNLQAQLLKFNSDMEIAFLASSGQEGVDLMDKNPVDVVLMNIQMPGMNGVETTRKILEKNPELLVIMLTALGGTQEIKDALKAGAVGYLWKEEEPVVRAEYIRETFNGGSRFTPKVSRKMAEMAQKGNEGRAKSPGEWGISKRELEVLKEMKDSLTAKQIAEKLNISFRTVRNHQTNIYTKLEVHSKLEAILFAEENGWFED